MSTRSLVTACWCCAAMLGGGTAGLAQELAWPIDCVPGRSCELGLPDIDGDGRASNCGAPGYRGHQGTDVIAASGTAVRAAQDGVVLWVFDGKHDNCPSAHPDCQVPPADWFVPGESNGVRVCTAVGPFGGRGEQTGFWCFDGGNVVVIRHPTQTQLFATRYDHFRRNSITVREGEQVRRGQKIGEVGSAGRSTGPHLHFEVWADGFYQLADPWPGQCGPNTKMRYWAGGNEPWAVTDDAGLGARVLPSILDLLTD